MRHFDMFYEQLVRYFEQYGNLNVKCRYVTPDGYKLGDRITCVRAGRAKITEEQRIILNEINFPWDSRKIRGMQDSNFKRYYNCIKRYYDTHGNCNIPQLYIDENGENVGNMVTYLRTFKNRLNKEQIQLLDEINFAWNVKNHMTSFEEFCRLHDEFKAQHGHCIIPVRYKTKSKVLLGAIANNFRQGKRKLTDEQKAVLDSIGFSWEKRKRKMKKETVE